MTIDYTRLNQQIVKQAIGNLVLTEEMKQRLFEDKIKTTPDISYRILEQIP